MSRHVTLKRRLLAIILASTLAAACILVWFFLKEQAQLDRQAERTVTQIAAEALRDYRNFAELARQILGVIAVLDPGSDCSQVAALVRVSRVQFATIELFDRNGRIRCNREVGGGLRNVGAEDWFRSALTARDAPGVAHLFADTSGRFSLRFTTALHDRKHQVAGVASLTVGVTTLAAQILPAGTPEHAAARLVDQHGRALDLGSTPGGEPPSPSTDGLTNLPRLVRDADGGERVRITQALGLGGEEAYVLIEVPRGSTLANIVTAVTEQGVLALLIVLCLGLALWHGVDFLILRRVNRLAGEVRHLRSVGADAPTGTTGELDHMSAVFDEMAEALQERTVEQEAVREMRERFDVAMRGSSDGMWDWNLRSNAVYFSPRYFQMLGFEEDELPHMFSTFEQLLHAEDSARVWAEVWAYLKGESDRYSCEFRMRHKDGHWHWILGRGVAMRDAKGTPERMVGTNVDITILKQTQEAMIAEKERVLVTLGSIGDAVISVSAQGAVEYLNPAAAALLGRRLGDVQTKRIDSVFLLRDEISGELLENAVHRCLRGDALLGTQGPSVLTRDDGRKLFVEHNVAPIKDASAKIIGAVMVMRDVTEQRRISEELSFQATHDALTGLINRFEFERRLKRVIATAANDDSQHAMCYLDLDQFKVVNDTCGHSAGDQLLRQLAQLLRSKLRKRDTLGRLGGDEFGVLLERCPPERARRIAQSLVDVVNEFRFEWEGKRFAVGVSIGLVGFGEENGTVQGIMTAADSSCYVAKERGRNRVHVYEPHDEDLVRRQGEMHWVSRITHAIEEERLLLYAQPILPLVANAANPAHYEILVRLQDERGEIIPPGAFIPAAERYNLMGQIDRWVIRRVCELLSRKVRGSDKAQVCGINLSGHSLGDETLQAFIRDQLERHRVAPQALCFEITETAAIANLSAARVFIHDLRKLGCAFALDDFGSGMSSFSYLKSLRVDYLKIDGAFVKDIAHDPVDRAIVEAINSVGHTLGIKTIAEYAESPDIIRMLSKIGVDFAQGFGFSEPRPAEGLIVAASATTQRQVNTRG